MAPKCKTTNANPHPNKFLICMTYPMKPCTGHVEFIQPTDSSAYIKAIPKVKAKPKVQCYCLCFFPKSLSQKPL